MTVSRPLFTLIVHAPAGTDADDLVATVDSVRDQSWPDWELLLPGGAAKLAHGDLRVRTWRTGSDSRRPGVQALDRALGEWTAQIVVGDTLAVDALEQLAQSCQQPDTDVVYSDEIEATAVAQDAAGHVVEKPDWSPERLRHGDYVGGLCALRTSLNRRLGGVREQFGAAAGYDLVLRAGEVARGVAHVPRALYRRNVPVETGPAVDELARAAVQDQLDRQGIAGVVHAGDVAGLHRITRELAPDVGVSVVIPTRGQSGEVRGRQRCFVVETVRSVLATAGPLGLEIVVVFDTDTPPDVLADLRRVGGEQLVLVEFEQPFNFSEKCNLGSLHATGDVLVLLNDDVQPVSTDWLQTLVAPLAELGVGMTGAKLLFEDGSVQHAGHMRATGRGMPFAHAVYRNASADLVGELGSLVVNRETVGVTAACAALRRKTWDAVGGLSELLPASFNDDDLSSKIRFIGLRVLFIADCVLFHFESRSRNPRVHDWEREIIRTRWGMVERDPYVPWLSAYQA